MIQIFTHCEVHLPNIDLSRKLLLTQLTFFVLSFISAFMVKYVISLKVKVFTLFSQGWLLVILMWEKVNKKAASAAARRKQQPLTRVYAFFFPQKCVQGNTVYHMNLQSFCVDFPWFFESALVYKAKVSWARRERKKQVSLFWSAFRNHRRKQAVMLQACLWFICDGEYAYYL